MGAPIGYTLASSLGIILGLALGNYFVTQIGYLVVVLLGTLGGLIIVTW